MKERWGGIRRLADAHGADQGLPKKGSTIPKGIPTLCVKTIFGTTARSRRSHRRCGVDEIARLTDAPRADAVLIARKGKAASMRYSRRLVDIGTARQNQKNRGNRKPADDGRSQPAKAPWRVPRQTARARFQHPGGRISMPK